MRLVTFITALATGVVPAMGTVAADAAQPAARSSAASNAFGSPVRPEGGGEAAPTPQYAPPGKRAVAKYLYQLSDMTGPVESSWASLVWDAEHKELYVVDRSDGTVGIFNDVGMETYRFGQDSAIGAILGVALVETGELLLLASDPAGYAIYRANFRGQPRGRIQLQGVPEAFAKDFWPDVIAYRAGKLYLAQRGGLKVLVTDASGACLAAHDYYRELGFDKMKTSRGGIPAMRAFSVDADGTVLFTISDLFRVFAVAPDGKLVSFGERGGSPGRFNVVGGITRDEDRNFIVTDLLRGVVMVFSADLEFQGEFAGRGGGAVGLVAPLEIAAGGGKVFVAQSANRGVSVFEYRILKPPPPAPPPDAASSPAQ